MNIRNLLIGAVATFATVLTVNANAQAESKWWPVKVLDLDSGSPKAVEYTPLKKAEKPWNICVLFPHMKDTFWLAVDYGVVEEAKALGVNMTLYQAGGYTNLPKQLSQFDDCLAANYNAIVVGPISEAGMAREFAKGMKSGKPIISTVNPVFKAPVTSKMFVDFTQMGEQTGKYLVGYLNGKEAKVGAFPGPAGSGWAEEFLAGFKEAIHGHKNIQLETAKFGDSGVAIQLRLIQNALQAYPDMNVIWGCAPAAEAAIGAIAEAGRPHIKILSAYENQAMLDDMKKHEILGFATQYAVLEGRVAIDTAVRALEHKPYMKYIQSIPDPISNENLSKINMSLVLAPPGFRATYQVKAQ
ncbi:MAG: TMAO reductase system periplasmic protein TorT [Acetobacteraceae bacterium]